MNKDLKYLKSVSHAYRDYAANKKAPFGPENHSYEAWRKELNGRLSVLNGDLDDAYRPGDIVEIKTADKGISGFLREVWGPRA